MTAVHTRFLLCAASFATVCAVLAGCDNNPTVGLLATCDATASVAPTSARIAVGDNVTISETLESGCPSPIVRNDSPALLQVDSVAPGTIRVTGLAAGNGIVRILSGVDTLVSTAVTVTVFGP